MVRIRTSRKLRSQILCYQHLSIYVGRNIRFGFYPRTCMNLVCICQFCDDYSHRRKKVNCKLLNCTCLGSTSRNHILDKLRVHLKLFLASSLGCHWSHFLTNRSCLRSIRLSSTSVGFSVIHNLSVFSGMVFPLYRLIRFAMNFKYFD